MVYNWTKFELLFTTIFVDLGSIIHIMMSMAKHNTENYTRATLVQDIQQIVLGAVKSQYNIGAKDIFALGYMCAKYDVKRLLDNQEEVIEACRKYDETDDLMLADTIGETLIDLDVIKNDGRI